MLDSCAAFAAQSGGLEKGPPPIETGSNRDTALSFEGCEPLMDMLTVHIRPNGPVSRQHSSRLSNECNMRVSRGSDDIPVATGFNRWAKGEREYKCRRHDRHLSCLRHSTILDEHST